MSIIKYREANKEDLAIIVSIYNSTVASRMVTADTEPITVESRLVWFDKHNSNQRPLWVVENEEEIVAWVSFQSFYGRPAYDATVEISIYIAETQRGKGFGKQILHYSIEKAPSLGIKTILGFIFSHNLPSIKLFSSFGFEVWGNLPGIATIDSEEYDLLILGKRISE